MRTLLLALLVFTMTLPLIGQGLQGGGHGSGGDEKAEYYIPVNARWNLMSVPFRPADYATPALFPTATTAAYIFQNGYQVEDTLMNGVGFWIKFGAAQDLPLNGGLFYSDSVVVNEGWNIIGSLSEPIASSSVIGIGTTISGPFYAFDNGYSTAGTIEPGRGYWVKTSSAGTLLLSSTSAPDSSGARKTFEDKILKLNSLIVIDGNGRRQTLYFGRGGDGTVDEFELPPLPPAGTFDARFASQKMVAVASERLLITSALYPVEVRWSIISPGDFSITNDETVTRLEGDGVTKLEKPSTRLHLLVGETEDLPRVFNLSQNFPNPFNPTTFIKFDLPEGAIVTLQAYDLLGRVVASLVEHQSYAAGRHQIEFNGSDLSSGIYFYRMTAQGAGKTFTIVKKMLLMK